MSDGTEQRGRTQLRPVWSHPAARALLLSRIVSDVGDFLGLAAILIHAFDETGTLLGPGAAFAAQAIPAVLIGLFAGRRLNLVHPRRGLVVTHLLAAVVVGLIVVAPSLWLLLLGVVGLGAARTASSSLRMAAIASSVPPELRQRVLGLSSTSYQLGQVVGFLGGAALVASTSPEVALLADAATFVLAAAVLTSPHIVQAPDVDLPAPTQGSPVRAVIESVQYVLGDRALALLVPLAWLTMLTSALPETAAPALARPGSVGLVMAAAPAASALASARYARGPATTVARLTRQAAGYGVALLVLAACIALEAPLVVLLTAILGVGAGNVWIVGVQTRLANLEDPTRVAEVYAALTASMIALEGIGAALLGVVAPLTGPAVPFAVLATLLTLAALRAHRRQRSTAAAGARPRPGATPVPALEHAA